MQPQLIEHALHRLRDFDDPAERSAWSRVQIDDRIVRELYRLDA